MDSAYTRSGTTSASPSATHGATITADAVDASDEAPEDLDETSGEVSALEGGVATPGAPCAGASPVLGALCSAASLCVAVVHHLVRVLALVVSTPTMLPATP